MHLGCSQEYLSCKGLYVATSTAASTNKLSSQASTAAICTCPGRPKPPTTSGSTVTRADLFLKFLVLLGLYKVSDT